MRLTIPARWVNKELAARAQELKVPCELVIVPGGHQEMVEPSVKKAIEWFGRQSAK